MNSNDKTIVKEKPIIRYIIKANGRTVDWTFSKKRAEDIALNFEYECLTQKDPFIPKMEIIEEK